MNPRDSINELETQGLILLGLILLMALRPVSSAQYISAGILIPLLVAFVLLDLYQRWYDNL